nr:group II truncated hemoglobin [Pseudofrankia inefficax]
MGSSLYAEVGGLDGLRRLSPAFYDRVLADELLAPVFAHFTPTHLDHVAVWLGEVFGGPEDFSATLGGHQALLRSHLGLGIRDEHRRRWLELMAHAISEILPGQPELAATLMAYFEWGTAIAPGHLTEPGRRRSRRTRPHPTLGTRGPRPLTWPAPRLRPAPCRWQQEPALTAGRVPYDEGGCRTTSPIRTRQETVAAGSLPVPGRVGCWRRRGGMKTDGLGVRRSSQSRPRRADH